MKTLNLWLDALIDISIWTMVLFMLSLLGGCGGGGGGSGGGSGGGGSSAPALYVFGDEIAAGTGATASFANAVAQNKGLVLHNVAALTTGGYTVNNTLGVTPTFYANQMKAQDTAIVFIGYQDMRWYGAGSGIEASDQASFINPFFTILISKGCAVYVMSTVKMKATSYSLFSPFNMGSDAAMSEWNTFIGGYVTAIGSPKIKFISAYGAFNPIDANLSADKQYLSDAGQAILATTLLSNW